MVQSEIRRTTPYHFPHETAMAGYSNITGGDDRYYNNIFLGDDDTHKEPVPITFFEHLPLKPRDETEEGGKAVMDGVPDDAICYLHPVGLGGYNDHPDVKGSTAKKNLRRLEMLSLKEKPSSQWHGRKSIS
ncbi:hypothetical protein [Alkalibacterium sp. 20]|uniref:hypothetical protein n=1 Tax=Alkalibacterium sp. 20 TaxID=1798803 RepID=UPI0009001684|nr:hypothetical protein [Alkalibacterium sp. 20]OJF91538.1 hypothetical protein AX762_03210 [Alkalibacterium sp. 20]